MRINTIIMGGYVVFLNFAVCIGTNGRLSVPSNRDHHYRNLRDRYTNCTYVDGNLELTWLQDEHLDLSFLQHIREVTGYVLITHVDVNKIVLPRLQIIRGRTQFKLAVKEEEFSLLVMLSKMNNLELPALRDILAGNVGMIDNYNLCHMRTINWDEIITGPGARWMYMYNFSNSERECPPCDKSCTGGCWGEGPHNCQKFSKINCSPQCYQGRCFGPKPRDCCHLFCAGGCTGPKQSDCLACRNFYDDGVCTQECPAMQRYNSITYSWETNPNGKYAYGATCVKNCPEHLLKDNGACVRSCPPKKKAVNGECVLCDGPCPKTCEGVATIHDSNIDGFKDCTVIEGSLTILDQTFKGFQQVFANFSFGQRIKAMHPDRLEVFSTLKEVTGYINIQGSHEDFKNLSYFRNLEVIGGRTVTEYFASLYIVKTSLTSLGLRSLKKIHSGSVAILENKRLCYAQTIDWESIKKSSEHPKLLQNNKNESLCILENEICDPECSKQGCWGPGPHQCLSCRNFQYDNQCLPNCSHVPGLYEAGDKTCAACHPECDGGCHGPGPEHCTSCRNLLDGIHCVSQCPLNKYSANQSRPSECLPCHLNCVGGCGGPDNTIGPNGCRSCHKAVLNADASVERCLHKNETCPNGYYYEWVGPLEQGGAALRALAGKAVCRKCHPRCLRCTGFGFHDQVCQRCAGYKRGDHCADDCPIEYYATTNKLPNGEIERECMPCDILCRGCYGPHASQCQACRHFKIFEPSGNPSDNRTAFNCSGPICPSFAPYKVYTKDDPDPYCSADDVRMASKLSDSEQIPLILSAVVVFTFLVMVLLMILVWHWRRRARAKETAVKMTMVLTGMEDNEPLRPSNVKPNTAKLRIVKEVDLRIGAELGNGAFGVVYKDENEILSNLATEGADMSIMEADEYCMNPKMGNSMPGPSRLGSSSTAGADMLGSMHGRHNWDRELRKFGDIHRLDCDTSDDLSNGSKAQVGTLKLDLPLDEDDYLMPSPANDEIDNKRRHAPANYIDLIGHQHAEAEYANGSLPRPPGLTKNYQPDFLPVQVSSVDNPEYHLTGGEPSAAAPSIVSGDGSGSVEPSCEPQSPVPTPNGRSLEDESDHEYYNDFDRLQRELQPLRRNETTV
ncbi:hypothetical protein AGLY_000320 [Aphis glycines]|uniref:receptor protein-tyrosine kinase n=1 Tax=Aphis glycines TaxID=307491 RepID=A0A6G0U6N1_APHGL|nr:hypothetical protein AGLY_000320 [Aphis glycines]